MTTFINSVDRETSPSEALQVEFLATRVSFTWFGVRRALSEEQKATAAEAFGAESGFLSAAKKLIDTRHPRIKAVNAVKSQIVRFWKGLSLPFPEPGIRLVRQEDLDLFEIRMTDFRDELGRAVEALEDQYEQIKLSARSRLGSLYNAADYPTNLQGLFAVDWSLENVSPPDYLLTLRPDLYERETRRVVAQFDQAVAMAEEAFCAGFSQLVGHLVDRLGSGEDGQPKQFADTTVTKLTDFFERFRRLSVRSNPQLDRLIEQAQAATQGVPPDSLREMSVLRQFVSDKLGDVQSELGKMMLDRPRRNVIRRGKPD